MIDEDRTLQLYGYTSNMLSLRSIEPIVKVCDECGTYSISSKHDYRNLCRSCSLKHPHKLHKPKFISEENRFMTNTQIDLILTIEKFGYDPLDLKDKSQRKVVRICKNCDKIKYIKIHQYRDLCQPCAFKQEERNINHSCTIQGITRDEFKEFLTDQKYCNLWTEKFREFIRNKFHNKCFICGKEQDRKLSVHHVNYNKNCLCGSTCEFVPLCGSCHSKTNINRLYWENLIMGYLYPERYFMVDL